MRRAASVVPGLHVDPGRQRAWIISVRRIMHLMHLPWLAVPTRPGRATRRGQSRCRSGRCWRACWRTRVWRAARRARMPRPWMLRLRACRSISDTLLRCCVSPKHILRGHIFVSEKSEAASTPAVLFCSVLFCSVLFCSVLFCSVLFCSVLFCSVLSVLFCSVLFCSVLFCSVLFCSVLFCSVLFCVMAGQVCAGRHARGTAALRGWCRRRWMRRRPAQCRARTTCHLRARPARRQTRRGSRGACSW